MKSMHFIIYGRPNCKFCDEAKSLVTRVGHTFDYRDMSQDRDAYDYVVGQGFKTVPQIYLADGDYPEHLGGFYDLRSWLEKRG